MLYPLFTQILNMGITASFVIIVIVLIRSILHGLPKKYHYFLWGIVGIRLVFPIAISSPISVFNMIGTDVTAIISMEKMESETNSSKIKEDGIFSDSLLNEDLSNNEVLTNGSDTPSIKEPMVSVQPQKGGTKNSKTKEISNGISSASGSTSLTGYTQEKQLNPIVKYGAVIWLTGIVWILLWNFYMTFCMKKKLERAVWYKENIYECENIPSPFVIGIFCPKIYIPFQLNVEEREYILKHELYHIKRKDYIIKPIAFLLVCIYWFHPLVWLSYVLMVRDMEMSCDEYVLQNMPADIRKDYSKSLLGFAVNQRGMAAGLLGFGETDTRKRVKNVLNFKKHRKWSGILAVILIIIVGPTCLTNAKNTDKKVSEEEKMNGEEDKNREEKDKNREEKEAENQEAVIASAEIHGYELQLVYVSEGKIPDKNDLELGMYVGTFELRTYREQIKYAEYPLIFDFKDTISYPREGLKLIVKDYDGDGAEDDFALGQGQTSMPFAGNYMSYQFYTVDENGTIARYEFSEDKKNLVTVPDEYSKDFSCKNGQITYQALGENGVEEQTVSVVRLIPVNTIKQGMQPLQDLMAAIETTMPEPIVKEAKEKGCWRLVNGMYSLGNAESNDEITMRLDFSYFGTELKQYVSKEYGFVDQKMMEDRIDHDQAKELIIAFEAAFLDRQIDKNDIKTYQGYSGYEGNDYAAFIDSNQDTFLVQLSRNMVIKYNADKETFKIEGKICRTFYSIQ